MGFLSICEKKYKTSVFVIKKHTPTDTKRPLFGVWIIPHGSTRTFYFICIFHFSVEWYPKWSHQDLSAIPMGNGLFSVDARHMGHVLTV